MSEASTLYTPLLIRLTYFKNSTQNHGKSIVKERSCTQSATSSIRRFYTPSDFSTYANILPGIIPVAERSWQADSQSAGK
jgi:hypothetical protein